MAISCVVICNFSIFRESLEDKLYVAKKVIVTEIGSAFHEIMIQFEKSRDLAEKKRIGSDMTNISIGHMIRGRFCTSLAALVLDGLRPYRLEGLVNDDIWKVTNGFCNEGKVITYSMYVSYTQLNVFVTKLDAFYIIFQFVYCEVTSPML